MLISPKDAEGVWCPFGRVAHQPDGPGQPMATINRDGRLGTTCRASACMAWRWAGWRLVENGPIGPRPEDGDKVGPRLGYCGLAGKPYGAP